MKLFHKVAIGCLLLGAVLASGSFLIMDHTKTSFAADPNPRSVSLSILWKKPVQPVTSITVSPDGAYSVTVGPEDVVTCRNSEGTILWQVKVKHATNALISAHGEMTLVYSLMNPAQKHVTFISPNGSIRWKHAVSGCIWSASVARDEPVFAVGDGDGRVCIYSVDEDRK